MWYISVIVKNIKSYFSYTLFLPLPYGMQ